MFGEAFFFFLKVPENEEKPEDQSKSTEKSVSVETVHRDFCLFHTSFFRSSEV